MACSANAPTTAGPGSRSETQPAQPEPVKGDPVTEALAGALVAATAAGRWDVVAQLAADLESRRRAAVGNVVSISARRSPK